MIPDESLEQCLTQYHLTWETVPRERHVMLTREWDAIYGPAFECENRIRARTGARAQDEYQKQFAEAFLVVPFLGQVTPVHECALGSRRCAYECHGGGGLPDLSAFHLIEFFISPPGMDWTMIHTHEDYSLAGPFFLRREWVVPPVRKRR